MSTVKVCKVLGLLKLSCLIDITAYLDERNQGFAGRNHE